MELLRAYLKGVILIFIFYILSIIIDQIHDKREAEKKFLILAKNNLVNDSSKQELFFMEVIVITVLVPVLEEIKINTLNLCNYGVERKNILKNFKINF